MDFQLELVFKNVPPMTSIKKRLEQEVEKLDQNFCNIESCRVDVDIPYHHRYPGNIYEFKVEVVVPGDRVSVSRQPSVDGDTYDVFAVIRDAFYEIERKLDMLACRRTKKDLKSNSNVKIPDERIQRNYILRRAQQQPFVDRAKAPSI